MTTTIEWRKNAEGSKPTRMCFCLIAEKIEDGEDGNKPYASIGRAIYIPKGTLFPLALCEYDLDPALTAEERLIRTIMHPDYWYADGGFYWEYDDGSLNPLRDNDITHWAELPLLPVCYAGNESDYMRDIWMRYPKDPNKVRVVGIK